MVKSISVACSNHSASSDVMARKAGSICNRNHCRVGFSRPFHMPAAQTITASAPVESMIWSLSGWPFVIVLAVTKNL